MIKLAFLTPMIAPYRVTFFEKLSRDFELTVFHGIKNSDDGRYAYQGATTFGSVGLLVEQKAGLIFYKEAVSKIRQINPDVLVVEGAVSVLTNWAILFFLRMAGKKTIIWACGWEQPRKTKFLKAIKRIAQYIYFNLAHAVITYSTKTKDDLVRLGIKEKKIKVALNGLDMDPYTDDYRRKVYDQALALKTQNEIGNKSLLLYVGGISADKRVDILLEAYKRFSKKRSGQTVLWIVGAGPELQRMERAAQDHGIDNLRFWGKRDDADRFFAAADLFILPGIGGLALNQALTWGKPCLVSEADGTEKDLIIEGKTGHYFTSGDPESLEKAIEEAFDLFAGNPETSTRCLEIVQAKSNVNEMVRVFTLTINTLSA